MHIPVSVAVEFTIAIVSFILALVFAAFEDPYSGSWVDDVRNWSAIITMLSAAIGVINLLWYWTI